MILIQPLMTHAAVDTLLAAATKLIETVQYTTYWLAAERQEYRVEWNVPGNTVEKVLVRNHGPIKHP